MHCTQDSSGPLHAEMRSTQVSWEFPTSPAPLDPDIPRVMQTIEDASVPALVAFGSAIAASALYAATARPRTKTVDSSESKSVATLAPRLPSTSFLLGELPAYLMNGHRVHDWITDKCLEMDGRLWRMVVPGQSDLVMISDPTVVEEVAQAKFDSFPRGPVQIEMLAQLFGNSLINSDGTRWYHQRKAAAKFFTANSLRACMTTTMHKNIGQVNAVIDKSIAEGKPFDLEAVFHGFAMQTFAEVGLGIDLPWIGSTERSPVQEHFAMASAATFRRHRVPPLVWKFERALHIGVERELADGMDQVREWVTTVVNDSLAAVAKRQAGDTTEEVKSMVELFLQHSDEGVEGMSPDDLVDFVLSFVLAAFETSASALCWFFLSVIKHPKVATKIKEEMARELPLLGVTDRDTYLTTTHVTKLLYLDATIKETLRLHPGIPLYQRQASRDEVIGGDTFIPKGTSIAVSPYAMARLPQIWGPDAAEFKPERWIDEAKQELRSVPNHRMPSFGAGPRSCIGFKLAMLELRVVTANLLHRYDFALAVPNNGDHVAALSLALKDPLVVSATRRGPL